MVLLVSLSGIRYRTEYLGFGSTSHFTNNLGKPIVVDVVHAAVAYDCEYAEENQLMIIRNVLYMRSISITLIPSFIMRLSIIEVYKCPKFLSATPSRNNQSIYFSEHKLRIPLKLDGIISYLPCQMTSKDELDNAKLTLYMTSIQ